MFMVVIGGMLLSVGPKTNSYKTADKDIYVQRRFKCTAALAVNPDLIIWKSCEPLSSKA